MVWRVRGAVGRRAGSGQDEAGARCRRRVRDAVREHVGDGRAQRAQPLRFVERLELAEVAAIGPGDLSDLQGDVHSSSWDRARIWPQVRVLERLPGWVRWEPVRRAGELSWLFSGESAPRLLHRWQRGLGLRERSRAQVDARGLGGDCDLLVS